MVELRDVERRRRRLYDLMETSNRDALNLGDVKPRLMELNERARAIESGLTQLELQAAPEVRLTDTDLVEVRDFVRDVVLNSNNPQKVRQFLATFIDDIVVTHDAARITYRKDRLVTAPAVQTVHSGKEWLPDQGSNLGPAD